MLDFIDNPEDYPNTQQIVEEIRNCEDVSKLKELTDKLQDVMATENPKGVTMAKRLVEKWSKKLEPFEDEDKKTCAALLENTFRYMKEVEAIVNQTDIIKVIVAQKDRHEQQLKDMDEKIELEIMSFYDKHDEALSEFRDIDHNLRDRINILEERVLSEVKGLSANKPNRWSWLVPFCILMTLLGAFAAYSRRKLKTLKSGL